MCDVSTTCVTAALTNYTTDCLFQLWAEQGVALDPRERELILSHPTDNVLVSTNLSSGWGSEG